MPNDCLNYFLAEYFVPVGCANVRSLGAHGADVSKDFVLAQTIVLCSTETWMDPKSPYEVDGFRCISAAKRSDTRAVLNASMYSMRGNAE